MQNDFRKEKGSEEPDMAEENFSALLEKNMIANGWLEPGQKVKSRVIGITGEFVYVDLGGKSDGIVDLNEFMDDEGNLHVKQGDEVEAFFLGLQDGIRKLTTRIHGYSAVDLRSIHNAHDAGMPVNGEVKREVKGGFEIAVGGVKCFCPFSQIDLKGGREAGNYVGKTFPFGVIEFKDDGRNIVLSRRLLLEEDRKARAENLKKTLAVGMEVSAAVRSLQSFGAFVDLGGIDGLIPVSELAWSRIERPEDVLSIGQKVSVKIISLDWESNRITLSIKAMQPDPWLASAEKYPVDSRVKGTVVRLVPFGAFVNLEPGIDGLIHISNLGAGRRIKHPREVIEAGQLVEVYVLDVDPRNRRISLSMEPKPKPEKVVLPSVGELLDGIVEKVMPFGIFLKMSNGLTGLIPNAEIGTPGGTDYNRMFPPGAEMQAVVIEVDTVQRKVRLSRRGVLEKIEREEFNHYKDSVKNDKSSGVLGNLGELLKSKIDEKRRPD